MQRGPAGRARWPAASARQRRRTSTRGPPTAGSRLASELRQASPTVRQAHQEDGAFRLHSRLSAAHNATGAVLQLLHREGGPCVEDLRPAKGGVAALSQPPLSATTRTQRGSHLLRQLALQLRIQAHWKAERLQLALVGRQKPRAHSLHHRKRAGLAQSTFCRGRSARGHKDVGQIPEKENAKGILVHPSHVCVRRPRRDVALTAA